LKDDRIAHGQILYQSKPFPALFDGTGMMMTMLVLAGLMLTLSATYPKAARRR
jgi:hypothetical protein